MSKYIKSSLSTTENCHGAIPRRSVRAAPLLAAPQQDDRLCIACLRRVLSAKGELSVNKRKTEFASVTPVFQKKNDDVTQSTIFSGKARKQELHALLGVVGLRHARSVRNAIENDLGSEILTKNTATTHTC